MIVIRSPPLSSPAVVAICAVDPLSFTFAGATYAVSSSAELLEHDALRDVPAKSSTVADIGVQSL
jgi:hypothetical protein